MSIYAALSNNKPSDAMARVGAAADRAREDALAKALGVTLSNADNPNRFREAASQAYGAGRIDTGLQLEGMGQSARGPGGGGPGLGGGREASAAATAQYAPETLQAMLAVNREMAGMTMEARQAAAPEFLEALVRAGLPPAQAQFTADELTDEGLERGRQALEAVLPRPEPQDIKTANVGGKFAVFDPNDPSAGPTFHDPGVSAAKAAELAARDRRSGAMGQGTWEMDLGGGVFLRHTGASGNKAANSAPTAEGRVRAETAGAIRQTQRFSEEDLTQSLIAEAMDYAQRGGTTGFIGQVSGLIKQTEAGELRAVNDQLKARLTTGAMQMLRESSVTGSTGFGQITQRELDILESLLGRLDPDMDREFYLERLRLVDEHIKGMEQRLRAAFKVTYGVDAASLDDIAMRLASGDLEPQMQVAPDDPRFLAPGTPLNEQRVNAPAPSPVPSALPDRAINPFADQPPPPGVDPADWPFYDEEGAMEALRGAGGAP